jgi:predicted nucleic-acid-binding Zn-ribbon protein
MTVAKTCPKCSGKMREGTEEVFGNVFGCSRNVKYLGKLQGNRIRAYYCEDCGYIELYKEKTEHPRIPKAERREDEREKAMIRREGQPPSIPSRERSYV